MITKYQGKAVCLTDYRSNGQRLPSSASSVCHFNFFRGWLESEVRNFLSNKFWFQVSAYAAVSERADALAGRGSICVALWKCQQYYSLLCRILKTWKSRSTQKNVNLCSSGRLRTDSTYSSMSSSTDTSSVRWRYPFLEHQIPQNKTCWWHLNWKGRLQHQCLRRHFQSRCLHHHRYLSDKLFTKK